MSSLGQPTGKRRRQYGSVRRTAAGRYQARYTAPDGTSRKAPSTFETKREAGLFLSRMQSQQAEGRWDDPHAVVPTVAQYVEPFQAQRRGIGNGPIKPKTLQLSEGHFNAYILPTFGELRLSSVTPGLVSRWYGSLPNRPALRRQLYSLMKAMMNAAVVDGYVRQNPCSIPRAGQNVSAERPHMSYRQVEAVLKQLPTDMEVLARLAFNTHLRLGEVLALNREDVDVARRVVHVRSAVTEVHNVQVESLPKSSKPRSIEFDAETQNLMRDFFNRRPRRRGERAFQRPGGETLRHFHVHTAWNAARAKAGLDQYRFHDLRHASLSLLSDSGASLKSIMHRAGHSTVNAALVYQHRSLERDRIDVERFAEEKKRARGQ